MEVSVFHSPNDQVNELNEACSAKPSENEVIPHFRYPYFDQKTTTIIFTIYKHCADIICSRIFYKPKGIAGHSNASLPWESLSWEPVNPIPLVLTCEK